MRTISRTLVGGKVRLPNGDLAIVRGIDEKTGMARITLVNKQGLEAVRDVPQDTLVSVPWATSR